MSKSMLQIRSARLRDAAELAPQLRQADRMEIGAHSGKEPLIALREALADSDPALAAVGANSEVLGLFGAVPHPQCCEAGIVWLLGSDALVADRGAFLRTSQLCLERLHTRYRILGNLIDARNTHHVRWLRWLGFKLTRRIERFGFEQRPFIEFCRALPKRCAVPTSNSIPAERRA